MIMVMERRRSGLLLLLVISLLSATIVSSFDIEQEKELWTAISTAVEEGYDSVESTIECDACQIGVAAIAQLIRLNRSEEDIGKIAAEYCIVFNVPKNYREVKPLCEGLVQTFQSEVVSIVVQKYVKPSAICTAFKVCQPTKPTTLTPELRGSIGITREEMRAEDWVAMKKKTTSPDVGFIYHISDIHTDNLYTTGAVIDCGYPLCCEYGQGSTPANSSQKWGEYAYCDVPPVFTQTTLQYMANLMDVDFMLWTGDSTPHDIWKQNQAEQITRLQTISQYVATAFPSTQIWPSFGNHDTYPINQFSLPPDIAWLMDSVGEMWSAWIPENSMSSFKYGGYYSAPIVNGLRMISLNTEWCDGGNFWLWLDVPDPAGQWSWFENTLAEAQEAKEKVYIIAHIPPFSITYNCSIKYAELVDKYNQTIVGQFFGHTHQDEFTLFRDLATNTIPNGIAYVAPSHTSYGGINPSFRVYEYNRTTFEILDIAQFHTDLNIVNANDSVYYTLEYSAKEAYNLADLSPASWENLVQQFISNDTLFQEFYQRIYSGFPQSGPCEGGCKTSWICEINNANQQLESACNKASLNSYRHPIMC